MFCGGICSVGSGINGSDIELSWNGDGYDGKTLVSSDGDLGDVDCCYGGSCY